MIYFTRHFQLAIVRGKMASCFNIKQIIVCKLILIIILSSFLQVSIKGFEFEFKKFEKLFKVSTVMSTGGNVTPAPDKVTSNVNTKSKKGNRYYAGKAKAADGIPELADCVFHCDGRAAVNDFQDNLDKLAKYVGSKYPNGGDLRASILGMAVVYPPRPTAPADWDTADPIDKKIWEIQITEHIKRVNKLTAELKSVFSLVWGQCSDYMRAKLKTHPDYEVVASGQDVISLLATIKSLTFQYDAMQYPPEALKNAVMKFYKFFQGRDMTTTHFYERFKNLAQVVEEHGGELGNDKGLINAELALITGTPYSEGATYTATQMTQARDRARDKYLAVLFLGASDRGRFSEVTTGLHNEFIKGQDNYPKTLTAAYTLLMETKLSLKNNVDLGSSFVQGSRIPSCWGCGKEGTVLSECTEPACVKKWEDRQQKKGPGKGHQSLMITDEALAGGTAELEQSFSFVQEVGYKIPPHLILLDSGSTHDTFYSDHMLTDIRSSPFPVAVNTNGGEILFELEGTLPGYGQVYYNPDGIANVLSMARVEEKGTRITYDTHKGSCFHLHNINRKIRDFHKIGHGLYLCDTTMDPFTDKPEQGHCSFMSSVLESVSLVSTVEENKRLFTPAEIRRAKQARELYKMVGRPSARDFIGLIEHKMIPNVKINAKDVHNAESIFGPDLGAIQGKTVRKTPERPREDLIAIPPSILLKFNKITLYADIMFVANIPFLITLSQHIRFYTGTRLKTREMANVGEAIIKVIRLYSRRGFHVKIIHVDGEFEPLRDILAKDYDFVTVNVTGHNDHNPNIERGIRTVKERFRALIITLPFRTIPLLMIVHGVIFVIQWLNFFPPKNGISPRLSPETMIRGRGVDARLHCRIPFGGYAQVYQGNEPVNDAMVSRTVGGISLGPTGNMQGTYKFLSVMTGRLIKGTQFNPLPMPRDVITAVENISRSNVGEVVIGNRMNHPDPVPILDDPGYDSDEDSDYMSAQEEEPAEDHVLEEDLLIEDIQVADPAAQVPGDNHDENEDEDADQGAMRDSNMPEDPPELAEREGLDDDEGQIDEATILSHDTATDQPTGSEADNVVEQNVSEIFQEAEEFFEEAAATGPAPTDETPTPPTTTGERWTAEQVTTRAGRPTRSRKFFMDEQADDIWRPRSLMMKGKTTLPPDHLTPSVRSTFGMKGMHAPHEGSTTNAHMLHYLMTQLSLKQGIKVWKQAGVDAVHKEMKQMHDLNVFEPVDKSTLTKAQLRQALRTIIFLKQKRCGRIKARACADGRKQRLLYSKEDATSPTVKTESVLITALIDAIEERDVAIVDIPGAFLRAMLEEVVHVCLRGLLAEIMVEISKETYGPYIFYDKNGEAVLYVKLTRALYGCLKSSLQFWKQLSGVLEAEGFSTNPYDSCVMNKSIQGSQCTITFHVDDLKISHKDPQVVSDIIHMLEGIYGEVAVSRGKMQTYLGIDFDFSVPGEVSLSMKSYLQDILDDFPEELTKEVKTPAADHLFDIDPNKKLLPQDQKDVFHQTVARLLWVAMRARPDILTALSFLTTRVQAPDEDDWKKLVRLMCYIQETINLILRLAADGSGFAKWLVDAAFANRDKFLSQTGGMLTMGGGAIMSTSRKQKLNTKSSTEAELVAVDDMMPQILWTRYFLLEQGFDLKGNVIYQDNQSAILLETNGTGSSSRRTRHINIRFYFVKDRVENGEVEINYLPTEEMTADFFTKPLQGQKFIDFRNIIMNQHLPAVTD